ncbi:MAG: hypothetical protein R3F14_10590 [Polyangiaceae bacterium]
MIVRGGLNNAALGDGAYDPEAGHVDGAACGAVEGFNHGGVWTGDQMIVAATTTSTGTSTGASTIRRTGGAARRRRRMRPRGARGTHADLTGTQMIAGGFDGGVNLSSGGLLDVSGGGGGRGRRRASAGAPVGRQKHVSVWAGSQMMVWAVRRRVVHRRKPPFDDGASGSRRGRRDVEADRVGEGDHRAHQRDGGGRGRT